LTMSTEDFNCSTKSIAEFQGSASGDGGLKQMRAKMIL
jgi:hypothetical protein